MNYDIGHLFWPGKKKVDRLSLGDYYYLAKLLVSQRRKLNMNVLEIVDLAKEGYEGYQELQTSGILARIEESIATDKKLIEDIHANEKLKPLFDKLQAMLTSHKTAQPQG